MIHIKKYENFIDADKSSNDITCKYCVDVLKPEEENITWRKMGDSKQTPICHECIQDYYERRGELPFLENTNLKCELCDEPISEGKCCDDCEELYNKI
jgi:hypothetical protein